MKYEVSERIETQRSLDDIRSLLAQQFRKISKNVEVHSDVIVAKSIEATFGSINRNDEAEVRVVRMDDGWLVVADVDYRPSGWFWLFLVVLLFTYIGWIFPIAFYLLHRSTVRSAVENALRRVANELRSGRDRPDAKDSSIDELEKLANLKERGFLTEEEFVRKKAQLLS